MTAGTRVTESAHQQLADLQHHWGSAFTINVEGDVWTARARNRANGGVNPRSPVLRDQTAAGLRQKIRDEYRRLTRLRLVR